MNYGSKKLFLPILIAGIVFLYLLAPVFAQAPTNYDVTVSPVFLDLSSSPGDKISSKIRIRNNTTSPLPIKLGIKQLTGDENGELTLKEDSKEESLSWIKLDSPKFTAKPLEWTNIPLTIDIPKNAAYGYYYAITFAQDETSPLTKTGAAITGAAAVPILLNVRKEGAKAEAKILKFSTKSYINEYLPVDFTAQLENTGNIHIRPRGNIFIGNGNDKNITILDINQSLGSIIPQTKRDFNASWSDGFIVREPVLEDGQAKLDKNGKPIEKLVINWNKLTSFRVGKYTANLLMVYDNGTRDVSLEANVSFWVIPYKVIIIMIVSLIVFVILIRFLLKFYINREIRRKLNR